ncbi:MAG TPA: hypothetical protein VGC10_03940 [Sphingomonas sp.]
MRDNKAFASLTSGLLARKGQARPAMRAQGAGFTTGKRDDLGWNDMGEDVPAPPPVLPPVIRLSDPQAAMSGETELPAVVRQQAAIAEALAAPAAETVVVAPPAPIAPRNVAPTRRAKATPVPAPAPREASRKAAFTLRIESERHLRLRLACAVQNRSAQQIITAALDRFLATLPDVERLAASLSATGDGQG